MLAWLEEGKLLTRSLAYESCDALDAIVDHVKSGPPSGDRDLHVELWQRIRIALELLVRLPGEAWVRRMPCNRYKAETSHGMARGCDRTMT